MDNKERYKDIFIRVFGVDGNELGEEFTFDNIEAWDSMTHLVLIDELEAEFDIMFDTEDILHFGGYLNGQKILMKYGVEMES